MREIVVDSFAGGGGASLGITMALGHGPDVAINHDPEAIALHAANHPETRHYREDVWRVDPIEATRGRRVGLMWLSPDCKHFSKAKGGKPVSPRVRGLAWVAVRWAVAVRPRVIILENVEEFQTWGPLDANQLPDPKRKGLTFRRFVGRLRNLGYDIQWRELRACDFGAPTMRRRLFIIARCDGQPIVWPTPTHGKGTPNAWRSAAECIDWSIRCPSIFLTQKQAKRQGLNVRRPLADATLRRIAVGIQRYVLDNPEPYIVRAQHGRHAAPVLVPRYGERDGQEPRALSITAPMPTIVPTANGASLVAAFMAQHNTDVFGHRMTDPVSTIVGKGCTQALVTAALGAGTETVRAFLIKYHAQGGQWNSLNAPMPTVVTKDSIGVVTYAINDIGMRMLSARELYTAQGFPASYRIDIDYNGAPLSDEAQKRMCGNSVCPPIAEALVRANYGEQRARRVA